MSYTKQTIQRHDDNILTQPLTPSLDKAKFDGEENPFICA